MPCGKCDFSKEDPTSTEVCDECYARVDYTGNVLRGIYFAYAFPCKINVKYFPFDKQHCELEVANWYMDQTFIDLYPARPKKGDPMVLSMA